MSPRFSVKAALENTVSSAFTSSDREEGVVSASAPEGSYTYAMITSGSVDATEVETSAAALEVTVKWGESVLSVAHLAPMRSFTIGEDADFSVDADRLGAARMELVHVAGDAVTIPSLGKSVAAGEEASVEIAGLTFEIKRVRAGKKVTGAKKLNKRALGLGLLGAALHAGVFATMFAFGPSLDDTDESARTSEQHANVQRIFEAMAEKELRETAEIASNQAEPSAPRDSKDPNEQPMNAPGSTTMRTPALTNGPMRTTNLNVTRADFIRQVQQSSMIELVSALGPISDDASFWSSDRPGNDRLSSDPGMWSDSSGGPFDPTKLLNPNDGGPATQAKLDRIHTSDCVGMLCKGTLIPTGLDPNRRPDGPVLRHKEEGKSGVAPELMQRVIRQNFGRFRACYENGLRTNPALTGRVVVALTVSPEGAVSSASDAGSSLPDKGVVSCIVRNFASLNFPAADGVGRIVYPLTLSPN